MGVDPLTVTAGAAVATGAAGTVLDAVQGAPDPRVVRLPPEAEAQQLEIIGQAVQDFESERARTLEAITALDQIGQTQIAIGEGLIPDSEGIQRLNQQTAEFGERFGQELPGVIDAINQDFQGIRAQLGQFDNELESNIRDRTEEILTQDRGEFTDPSTERQIQEGRDQLVERLTQQFGPGFENTDAGIRALNAFEQGARETRFQVSEQGRSNEIARLQGLASAAGSARQSELSTLGGRLSGLQAGQSLAASLFSGQQQALGTLSNQTVTGSNLLSAGAGAFQGASQLAAQNQANAQNAFGLFQQFGSQRLSRDIRRNIESGGSFLPDFTTRREAGRVRNDLAQQFGGDDVFGRANNQQLRELDLNEFTGVGGADRLRGLFPNF